MSLFATAQYYTAPEVLTTSYQVLTFEDSPQYTNNGVAFDGEYFWTSSTVNNEGFFLLKYDTEGNLVEAYDQQIDNPYWGMLDITFNSKTRKIYGGDQSGFYEVDVETGDVKKLWDNPFGRMYALTNDGEYFYAYTVEATWSNPELKMRKFDIEGNQIKEAIHSTKFKGLAYDPHNDVLWGYHYQSSKNNLLVQYNKDLLRTGVERTVAASKALPQKGIYYDDYHTTPGAASICILTGEKSLMASPIEILFDPTAPTEVTDLTVTKVEAATSDGKEGYYVYLEWTNPSTNLNGDALEVINSGQITTDADNYSTVIREIYADPMEGTPIAIGGVQKDRIFTTNTGLNTYRVQMNNGNLGMHAQVTVYIGEDSPAAPKNLTMDVKNKTVTLNWEVPTEGKYGGTLTNVNFKYDIYRMPERILVASDLTEKTFTETLEKATYCAYRVLAKNDVGEGAFAETDYTDVGAFLLREFFDGEEFPDGWGVIADSMNWILSETNFAGGDPKEIRFDYSPYSSGTSIMATPEIIGKDIPLMELKFKQQFKRFSHSCEIGVAINNGESWTKIWSWKPGEGNSGNMSAQETTIPLVNHENSLDKFRIGFYFKGVSYNISKWSIDDVEVRVMGDEKHDLAVSDLTIPERIKIGEELNSSATVANIGTSDIAAYDLWLTVKDQDDTEVFNYNKKFEDGILSATYNTDTPDKWTPEKAGIYTVTAKIMYGGIKNYDNNSIEKEIIVTPNYDGNYDDIKSLVYCANDTSIKQIDFESYEITDFFDNEYSVSTPVSSTYDGKWMYTLYEDGTIMMVDGSGAQFYYGKLSYFYSTPSSIMWDATREKMFVTGRTAVTTYLFELDMETLKCSLVFRGHDHIIAGAAVSERDGIAYGPSIRALDSICSIDLETGQISGVKKRIDPSMERSTYHGVSFCNNVLYAVATTEADKNNSMIGYYNLSTAEFEKLKKTELALSALNVFDAPDVAKYNVNFEIVDGGEYEPIEGALVVINNQTHTTGYNGKVTIPLKADTYEYTVYAEGFPDYTNSVEVDYKAIDVYIELTTSSVGEIAGESFTVYPNPVADNITISGNLDGGTASIYNMTGVKVMEWNINSQSKDVSDLVSGIYFIEITKDNESKVVRIIKK